MTAFLHGGEVSSCLFVSCRTVRLPRRWPDSRGARNRNV